MRAMYHYTRKFPGQGGRVFFDQRGFPWIEEIERNHAVFRKEAERLLQKREWLRGYAEISKDNAFFAPDNVWRSFVVYTRRDIFPIGREICPATYELVKNIPRIWTAAFSFLDGKSRIPQHEGYYSGRLRYHLGVVVPGPRDSSALNIGGQTQHWREGKGFVFDDTYMHDAHNDADTTRVVLMIDVERPLPGPLVGLNRKLIYQIAAARAGDVDANCADWERRIRDSGWSKPER